MRVNVSFTDLKIISISGKPILPYRNNETNEQFLLQLSDKELETIKTLVVPDESGWNYIATDFDALDMFVSMMFINRGIVNDTD